MYLASMIREEESSGSTAGKIPFSLIALGTLMLYQVFSMIVKFSVGMFLLTVFDAFILWLIWREYGKVRPALTRRAAG